MARDSADGSSASEEFRAASGRVTGALVIVVAVAALALAVFDGPGGFGPRIGATALFLGVLAWVATLRPRIRLTDDHLVLHNMFQDVHLPLAAVEEMAVRQVFAVRVADRRFVSPVLGRSMREVSRGRRGGRTAAGTAMGGLGADPLGVASAGIAEPARLPGGEGSTISYVDFVEERIRGRVEEARTRAGVRRGSPEQRALADVRRRTAWVPVLLVAAAALALTVALVR